MSNQKTWNSTSISGMVSLEEWAEHGSALIRRAADVILLSSVGLVGCRDVMSDRIQ